MLASGRRWTVRDRYNNEVYLTHERWEHLTNPINHPEMAAYEGICKTPFGRASADKTRCSHKSIGI